MATAFGAEGCCLLHMLSEIEGPVFYSIWIPVTGSDISLCARTSNATDWRSSWCDLIKRWHAEASNGGSLHSSTDRCCLNAGSAVAEGLVGQEAWISAIRRDQTIHRGAAQVVQWDAKFGLVKISPLLNWTKKDVWSFVARHDVPYNPLHDQGFPSIGCWPCTQAVEQGADDRAGRWAGSTKKECGLHVLEHQDGSGI